MYVSFRIYLASVRVLIIDLYSVANSIGHQFHIDFSHKTIEVWLSLNAVHYL